MSSLVELILFWRGEPAARPRRVTWGGMTESRNCAECGAVFTPRREHARFCSPQCRVAWNREHVSSPGPGGEALDWAMAAMLDTTGRLLRAREWDKPNGFAVITESVWWVTMVDATLVRYHPDAYGQALASQGRARRKVIENTFGGLRYVRNRMGCQDACDDFIQANTSSSGEPADRVAAWKWKALAKPALSSLPARGQEWEMTRYRSYQAQLASHPLGDTFTDAAGFLRAAFDSSWPPLARMPYPR
jgi:hypothetical protein